MDLKAKFSILCLKQICLYFNSTWWFLIFYIFDSQLNLKSTWFRNFWFCCGYFCMANLMNPKYIQYLAEWLPTHKQNTVAVNNKNTILILYYICSTSVILFKTIVSPIKFHNIFYLTVNYKLLKFELSEMLSFCSWNVLYHQALHFSDYLHCFDLDPVPKTF
jgi:hypothetical protein